MRFGSGLLFCGNRSRRNVRGSELGQVPVKFSNKPAYRTPKYTSGPANWLVLHYPSANLLTINQNLYHIQTGGLIGQPELRSLLAGCLRQNSPSF